MTEIAEEMNVNYIAPVTLIKYFLPHFLKLSVRLTACTRRYLMSYLCRNLVALPISFQLPQVLLVSHDSFIDLYFGPDKSLVSGSHHYRPKLLCFQGCSSPL